MLLRTDNEQVLDALKINFDTEGLWALNITLAIIMFGVALGITLDDMYQNGQFVYPWKCAWCSSPWRPSWAWPPNTCACRWKSRRWRWSLSEIPAFNQGHLTPKTLICWLLEDDVVDPALARVRGDRLRRRHLQPIEVHPHEADVFDLGDDELTAAFRGPRRRKLSVLDHSAVLGGRRAALGQDVLTTRPETFAKQ